MSHSDKSKMRNQHTVELVVSAMEEDEDKEVVSESAAEDVSVEVEDVFPLVVGRALLLVVEVDWGADIESGVLEVEVARIKVLGGAALEA